MTKWSLANLECNTLQVPGLAKSYVKLELISNYKISEKSWETCEKLSNNLL